VHLEDVFTYVAVAFEALGALAMIVGVVIAAVLGIRSLGRGEGGSTAFQVLRTTLGSAILLGLEVLVAADLIRTITSKPSMEDALILGLIVLIRTVLSMSIQIEIEGVLPWRRALITSGGQMLGEAVARDRAAARDAAS
jgi:Predicted membrane protein